MSGREGQRRPEVQNLKEGQRGREGCCWNCSVVTQVSPARTPAETSSMGCVWKRVWRVALEHWTLPAASAGTRGGTVGTDITAVGAVRQQPGGPSGQCHIAAAFDVSSNRKPVSQSGGPWLHQERGEHTHTAGGPRNRSDRSGEPAEQEGGAREILLCDPALPISWRPREAGHIHLHRPY